MNYYNPIGVVALPQGKGFNKNSFLDFVRDSNMKCAVVLDDLLLCASLGIPYPIYRSFTFEPNPGSNPKAAAQQAVEYIKAVPNFEKVYWYINNEPDVTLERFEMYAEMIRVIRKTKLPIKCVFGNFSSGSVRCGQGGDANEWLTKGESFLEAITGTEHLIGVHEYTSFTPWYVSDGGKHMGVATWKSRPSLVNWSLPQWHIGRNMQGIASACVALGIAAPRVIVTEALIDRMNDLPNLSNDLNGYKSYQNRWSVQFPEYALGELYSEFLIWAWETIYATAPVPVEAVTTFCYGNTGNWANYNVADDPAYLSGMREYRYAPKETPVPETVPDTSYPELRVLARLPQDFVNVRSTPDVMGEVNDTLRKGERVLYYPNSITNGWVYIRDDNGMSLPVGWVSLQNGAVEFEKYIVTPPPDYALALQKITEAFWIMRASFDSLKIDIDALQKWVDEI